MATIKASIDKPKPPRSVYVTFSAKGEKSKSLTVYGSTVQNVREMVLALFGKSAKSK